MKQSYLEIGRILSTHALSGEVKFEHWGDDETVARSVRRVYLDRNGKEELTVKKCRTGTKHLLYTFDGIDNVDAAALLRGKILYARREDIANEDTVFWADLIGTPAVDDRTGKVYGTIRDIYNRGASDVWEIEQDGRVVLFPAAACFIARLDAEEGARILPPEGLF